MNRPMPSDAELREWIETTRTIAVLGAKTGANDRPSTPVVMNKVTIEKQD